MNCENCCVKRPIIAIDGPSGAGKSTLTKLLAERLGYIHIDTGAMFRTMALAVARAGIDPDDEQALAKICGAVHIRFERDDVCCRVFLGEEDVSGLIRTPEISMLTSRVSAKKVVRDLLLAMQREMGRDGGVILEGRDIGTVVFPDAEVKFFLSASPEKRGERRYRELRAKGEQISLEATIEAVKQRDAQDACREHAPLKMADDALLIDSTALTPDEVLNDMERVVIERCSKVKTGALS